MPVQKFYLKYEDWCLNDQPLLLRYALLSLCPEFLALVALQFIGWGFSVLDVLTHANGKQEPLRSSLRLCSGPGLCDMLCGRLCLWQGVTRAAARPRNDDKLLWSGAQSTVQTFHRLNLRRDGRRGRPKKIVINCRKMSQNVAKDNL